MHALLVNPLISNAITVAPAGQLAYGPQSNPAPQISTPLAAVMAVSGAASAYHGYKRNESVGWAVWWGIMGASFPVIVPAIAFAQGFGQRARGLDVSAAGRPRLRRRTPRY